MKASDSSFKATLFFVSVIWGLFFLGCGNEGNPFGVDLEPKLSIENVNPPNNSIDISTKTLISISFPTDIESNTLNDSNLVLQTSQGRVMDVNVAFDESTRIATVRPLRELQANTLYQLVVSGIRSSNGEKYESTVFTFSTSDSSSNDNPEITSVSPLPGQEGLPSNVKVKITFSKAMNEGSVETAFNINNGVNGLFNWADDSKTLVFSPSTPLGSNSKYVVTLLGNASDVEGNQLRASFTWYFKTAEIANFKILESIPQNGASTVSAASNITYKLSQPVDRTTVVSNFSIDPIMTISSDRFSYQQNDQTIVYEPPNPIAASTLVRATWTSELTSVTGQTLEDDYTITYTIENIPPEVISVDPMNGASQVEADQVIRYRFSEVLDRTTVLLGSSFIVEQPVGTSVSGGLSFEENDRVIAFTPSTGYVAGANPVTVRAETTISDLGGTTMTTAVVSVFTIDDNPPGISLTVPTAGSTDVVPNQLPTLIVEFTEAVDQTAVEGGFNISPTGMGGQFAWSSQTRMQYTTDAPLLGATSYSVTLNIVDLAGNSQISSFSFTTDDDPPTVTLNVDTIGGAMALDSNLTFRFSEAMQRESIEQSFRYEEGLNTFDINDGTVSWSPNDVYPDTFIFDPSDDFTASRSYTFIITDGAVDIGGLPLNPSYSATINTTDS